MAAPPRRETREKGLSWGERGGANTPAGSPGAPLAGASAASSPRTLQPRRARLAAQACTVSAGVHTTLPVPIQVPEYRGI